MQDGVFKIVILIYTGRPQLRISEILKQLSFVKVITYEHITLLAISYTILTFSCFAHQRLFFSIMTLSHSYARSALISK